jgi:hypothetical protein
MQSFDNYKTIHRHCPSHNEHGCKISKYGSVRNNFLQNFIRLDEIIIDELYLFMRQWDIHLDFIIAYCESFHFENELKGFFFFNFFLIFLKFILFIFIKFIFLFRNSKEM